MGKRDLIYILKDFLPKRLLSVAMSSDTQDNFLLTGCGDYCKPPGGTRSVDSCDLRNNDPQAILCVEISSSKIVALVGVLNFEKQIEILGFGEHVLMNIGKESGVNISEIAAAIRYSIATAMETSGLDDVKAVCSNYSGPLTISPFTEILIRDNNRQEIEAADMESLTAQMYMMSSLPGEEVILIQTEDYTVDGIPRIVQPVGMLGRRIEGYYRAIAGRVSALDSVERCFQQADLHLKVVYPSGLASAESVLLNEEREGSIALIDIGASITHIAVFEDGVLIHAETIPLGGCAITTDLQQFTGLTFQRAEMLKLTYSRVYSFDVSDEKIIQVDQFNERPRLAIPLRDLKNVVEARVEELISLAYGRVLPSLNNSKPDLGIVITGAGVALFPGIESFVKNVTGVTCSVGFPNLYMGQNRFLSSVQFEKLKSPRYATCIGMLKLALSSKYS